MSCRIKIALVLFFFCWGFSAVNTWTQDSCGILWRSLHTSINWKYYYQSVQETKTQQEQEIEKPAWSGLAKCAISSEPKQTDDLTDDTIRSAEHICWCVFSNYLIICFATDCFISPYWFKSVLVHPLCFKISHPIVLLKSV